MALHAVGSVQLLNCARGQATTISVLQDFAKKPENLICLLQEPWCDRHGQPPSLPGFNSFTPTPIKPKCVTYVRQIPGLTASTFFTSKDSFLATTITSSWNGQTNTFTLFNLYSPGRPEPVAALLPALTLPADCLLMGDLNAHHPWWQGPLPRTTRTSPTSHTIANWLEENNFHLQNEPAIPTHHPRNGGSPSTIVLCLSRGATTRSILSLAVDHDTTSDHSTLMVTLALPSAEVRTSPRRCWYKADWRIFDTKIQSTKMELSQLQGPEDTLRAVTNVTKLIHQAVDAAVPMKKPRKSEAPWWNHSLTLAKQSVKRADRRARLQPTDMNLKDSQCKCHKWTTMVRNAKTAYRIHQLEATSTRTVWKMIQHHNTHHKPIPPLDGQSDFKGKCDVLRNTLFPTVNTVLRPSLPPNLLTSSKDLRQQTRQVTRAEIHLAIIHLKYGTSVGPDKITYDTLRRFNEAVPQLLPHLFTACLAYAVHPPEWKTANCVVIPKPGKKSYSHPKS